MTVMEKNPLVLVTVHHVSHLIKIVVTFLLLTFFCSSAEGFTPHKINTSTTTTTTTLSAITTTGTGEPSSSSTSGGSAYQVRNMDEKLENARQLYNKIILSSSSSSSSNQQQGQGPSLAATVISVAPGRVNLIGEHTDYTGGFVLPFAIDHSTVVYGRGTVKENNGHNDTGEEKQERKAILKFISDKSPDEIHELTITESSKPPEKTTWTTYVLGTVYQYLRDLPSSKQQIELIFSIVGDVPLGSGLSSSASLEVSVARFVEAVLGESAFSSETKIQSPTKIRALRCQRAENEWCHSPCGIMDQAVSSAAKNGSLLLIDCRSLTFTETKMAETSENGNDMPVLVIANSNVQHDIGGGEYPARVEQCKMATQALQEVNPAIQSLRDATLDDVEKARGYMDDISYKRSKHVITENERTLQAKEELERGDWKKVGALMNASHASMRDDYEVSCEEVDLLVDIAQSFPGVYGSRLTGGGFGGCTVTLVSKEQAPALIAHMQDEYQAKTGKYCPCFETVPSRGAHLLSVKDHKPFV